MTTGDSNKVIILFVIKVYVAIICNAFLIISNFSDYRKWFISSLIALLIGLFMKFREALGLIKNYRKIKIHPNLAFLFFMLLAYPKHYKYQDNLGYLEILIFQAANIFLFIIVFGLEIDRKESDS